MTILEVKNVTQRTRVAAKIRKTQKMADRLFGMILSRNSNGLILSSRFGIHTFFMKNPIDVLILDKDRRVVRIRENLMPNSVFIWNPKYNLILELPVGSIRHSKTKLGDVLDF